MEFSYREKYAEAARILESITWRYGHNRWTVLENELVIKHAKCLRELGDTMKYAQACLTLLRNMDDLKDDEKLFYSNELFSTVTSKELKQDIYHEFVPMFTVKVVSVVEILQDDDGSYVEIMIENKLPKDIDFNKLSLRMVSGEVDELWFNFRHGVLKPGKNTFRVTCEVSLSFGVAYPTKSMGVFPKANSMLTHTHIFYLKLVDLGVRHISLGEGTSEDWKAGVSLRLFT